MCHSALRAIYHVDQHRSQEAIPSTHGTQAQTYAPHRAQRPHGHTSFVALTCKKERCEAIILCKIFHRNPPFVVDICICAGAQTHFQMQRHDSSKQYRNHSNVKPWTIVQQSVTWLHDMWNTRNDKQKILKPHWLFGIQKTFSIKRNKYFLWLY